MDNTLTVEFRLFGRRCDPALISEALGRRSTHSETGDISFWILSTTKTVTFDVERVCADLIAELQPLQEKIDDVMKTYALRADLCLSVSQRPRTDAEIWGGLYPVTNFYVAPATMRFLAAIGATLHIEDARRG